MGKFDFRISVMVLVLYGSMASCSSRQSESPAAKQSPSTAMTAEVVHEADSFYEAIYQFSIDHASYHENSDQLVDTIIQVSEHWFLNSLEQARKRYSASENERASRQLSKLPTPTEMNMIKAIRAGSFYLSAPSQSDMVFEEWRYESSVNAERWLILLKDSLRTNDYTKPPRFQWVEDSTLYLVSARSAQQWFEMGDSLVMALTGKTKAQMSNIYNPLDLQHFKKWQGPSNSSTLNTQQHLYATGSGAHYSYFFFVKQRLAGEARTQASVEFPTRSQFNITTSLLKPLSGEEQYDTIEETLVAIQCGITEPALNNLNILGKQFLELQELFGEVLFKQDKSLVFGHSNRIIAARMEAGVVQQFKYMRLVAPFAELQFNDEMMNSLLNFE